MEFNELKEKLLSTNCFEDNEYLDQYCELIYNNEVPYQIYKTQSHHILPQCYFTSNNLEIDNSQENLVNLLYKHHLLAHYYLFKCALSPLKEKLIYAYIIVYNFGGGLRVKDYKKELSKSYLDTLQAYYEEARKQISIFQTGKKKSIQMRLKLSKSKTGFHHSLEDRQKMHDIKMSIPKDKFDSIYKGISEKRKGSVWLYNESLNQYTMASRDSVESYILQGWVRKTPVHSRESYIRASEKKRNKHRNQEQRKNHSLGHKGKIFINKDLECIMIYPDQLQEYLDQGWKKGRLKRK